jgi:hypothetical protein
MVAGRNREIRALQEKMAGNQGGTARQQKRMDYLQGQQGSVGNPERQAQRDNYLIRQAQRQPQQGYQNIAGQVGPGGQDAMRTQQPWNAVGGQMSNGGTTWNGQSPMNPYGAKGGVGFDKGHPNQGPQYFDPSAPNYQDPSKAGVRDAAFIAGRDGPMPGGLQQQQEQIRRLQQEGKYIGFNPNQPPPMQRPTPGQNIDPGFALPPGSNPMQRPTAQGPDYFRGQGMGMDRFNQPGYQAPQQPVQGDWFRGGGMGADRFSKFGAPAPMQTQVQGNQIRGGGYGPNTQRVNRKPVGILSKPPQN